MFIILYKKTDKVYHKWPYYLYIQFMWYFTVFVAGQSKWTLSYIAFHTYFVNGKSSVSPVSQDHQVPKWSAVHRE